MARAGSERLRSCGCCIPRHLAARGCPASHPALAPHLNPGWPPTGLPAGARAWSSSRAGRGTRGGAGACRARWPAWRSATWTPATLARRRPCWWWRTRSKVSSGAGLGAACVACAAPCRTLASGLQAEGADQAGPGLTPGSRRTPACLPARSARGGRARGRAAAARVPQPHGRGLAGEPQPAGAARHVCGARRVWCVPPAGTPPA